MSAHFKMDAPFIYFVLSLAEKVSKLLPYISEVFLLLGPGGWAARHSSPLTVWAINQILPWRPYKQSHKKGKTHFRVNAIRRKFFQTSLSKV